MQNQLAQLPKYVHIILYCCYKFRWAPSLHDWSNHKNVCVHWINEIAPHACHICIIWPAGQITYWCHAYINAADLNKCESAKELPSLEPKTAKESRSILASRHFYLVSRVVRPIASPTHYSVWKSLSIESSSRSEEGRGAVRQGNPHNAYVENTIESLTAPYFQHINEVYVCSS